MEPRTKKYLIAASRFGIAARGVVFGVIGVLIARAIQTHNPRHARGVKQAMLEILSYGRIPFLIIAVGLSAISGPSLTNAVIALGIAQIPTMIRVVRGETLRIRETDFVLGAKTMDASGFRIIFSHILPNCVSAIIVQATVIMPDHPQQRKLQEQYGYADAVVSNGVVYVSGTLAFDKDNNVLVLPTVSLQPGHSRAQVAAIQAIATAGSHLP
mgnify:CR=1 FL=1